MMFWWNLFVLVIVLFNMTTARTINSDQTDISISRKESRTSSNFGNSWSLEKRIPMLSEFDDFGRGKKLKLKKKLKQFLLPLLLAYKLKFFTLVPILVGGLLLLTASTGLAGFFFALFAAAMGLKHGSYH